MWEFEPTALELHWAGRLVEDPSDRVAERHLRTAAESDRRAAAVLRHVRRQIAANEMIGRITP